VVPEGSVETDMLAESGRAHAFFLTYPRTKIQTEIEKENGHENDTEKHRYDNQPHRSIRGHAA